MNLTICDDRSLYVMIFNPKDGSCWNWQTGVFEFFNPAAHLVPVPSVPNFPASLSAFKKVFVQQVLAENPGACAGLVTVDASGTPTKAIDVFNSPFATSYPTTGGIR